jgi:hypothetical protein
VHCRPYKRVTCYMNIFFCVLPALQARHVLHEHLFLCIAGPTRAPRAKWTSFFVYCRPYKGATCEMDIFFCVLPALQARHVLNGHLFLCIAGPISAPPSTWTSLCRPSWQKLVYWHRGSLWLWSPWTQCYSMIKIFTNLHANFIH